MAAEPSFGHGEGNPGAASLEEAGKPRTRFLSHATEMGTTMTTRSLYTGMTACLMVWAALVGGCESDPTSSEMRKPSEHTSYKKDQLRPEGEVTQTADGYHVRGALHVDAGARSVSLLDADLDVSFDANGNVSNVSGRARIASPHERIEFADPVQADVGFFSGRELNARGELGILLKDDTDYFVYRYSVSLEMRIATGETGANATKPLVLRAPVGYTALMVVDYTDPMYYVYGAHDLLGATGVGWSHNGRLPYVPRLSVQGLGYFDGKNIRTGTFPVFKVISVTGELIDGERTEVHLVEEDPFSSDLSRDYKAGFNGEATLDLFLKDIAGIEIPLAEASGGVWRNVSLQSGFHGNAWVHGRTADDASWWPTFIPARPVLGIEVSGMVTSDDDFEIRLAGEYGWDLPTGYNTMLGEFLLTPEAMTLTGGVKVDDITYLLRGTVTHDWTSVAVVPPAELKDMLLPGIRSEIDVRFAEAEKAYQDLVEATKDYEFELSLRGLRNALPGIVDFAKKQLSDGIAAELRKHEGTIYYSQLKSQVNSEAAPYYHELDRLKAAAREIKDNDATRKQIEAVLRSVAARKIFTFTFKYKQFGITLATVTVTRRVMSDADAAKLIATANNVKYIKETSDRKIRMQQIYDAIPSKERFEQIRDEIDRGVANMPVIGEFGFQVSHDALRTLNAYAIINGERHELGSLDIFSVPALVGSLAEILLDHLLAN